ncbi:MAG: hypothetical protein ACKOI2_02490 [Actinomycetota bacterium]
MSERVKRPFWLHQIAEYIIGVALIGSGLQSPSSAVPAVIGGLVLLNAAMVDGPFGAFRVIGRKAHRIFDFVLLAVGVVGAVLPGLDLGTRIVLVGCLIVFATVVLNTNYAPKQDRATRAASTQAAATQAGASDRPDEIGRTAGRVAGTLAGQARAKWRARQTDDSRRD